MITLLRAGANQLGSIPLPHLSNNHRLPSKSGMPETATPQIGCLSLAYLHGISAGGDLAVAG